MLATSSPSAGVYTAERDNTQRITPLGTSVGAVVGYSDRGPVMERTLTVDNTEFQSYFGIKSPDKGWLHYSAEAFLEESSRLYVTRVVNGAKTGCGWFTTVDNFVQGREVDKDGGFDWDEVNPVHSAVDVLFIQAHNPGTWNNKIRVVLSPDTSDDEGHRFHVYVYEGDSTIPVEQFLCTTFYKVENGKQLFVEDVINKRSKFIKVQFNFENAMYEQDEEADLVNAIASVTLNGGTNGDPINDGHIIQGWDLYDDWEAVTVNILINSGYSTVPVQLHMDTIAQYRYDCIAVLDCPEEYQEAAKSVDYRRNVLSLNSSFSALYTPDILIRDTINQMDLYAPPSGWVAAQYAYTDRVKGAWYAPAGEKRGTIKAARGTRHQYRLGHRNAMAESQVNNICVLENVGTVIMEQYTLQSIQSITQNVHARRLLAMLRASVRMNNLNAVHELIDEVLMGQQRQALTELLTPIKNQRGLYWFDVRCDPSNNPPEVTDNGDLIVDVYLQITQAAKRIHVNAVLAKTGQIKFAEELIANGV